MSFIIIVIGTYAFHIVTHVDELTKFTKIISINDITGDLINEDFLRYICLGVIGFGFVIFTIYMCGCFGSVLEKKRLLVTYATVMFILAGASIFVLFSRTRYFERAERSINLYINGTFNSPDNPIINKKINAMQYIATCCGTHGPEFYNERRIEGIEKFILEFLDDKVNISGVGLVPPSCCSTFDLHSFLENQPKYFFMVYNCTKRDVYTEGCVDKIGVYLKVLQQYLTVFISVITGFEVVSFLFGVYMCYVIK
ncbi:CD63 antigen-like isoform X2 [Plodia interpunctella]|nr:CD63 antigen-like isoform X2 [Plodia interpunctella]